MTISTNLHIAAIFEIFCVSIIGFALPFYYTKQFQHSHSHGTSSKHHSIGSEEGKPINKTLYIIRSFSTGIILGVAFLHLLAESGG